MEKYNFTIPAGGKVDVNATGNRIYCEAANGVFLLKSGNQTLEMKAKRAYVLKHGLEKFLLENRGVTPIDVEIHIGDDEIIDNEVMITGTISGDVKIVNSDTAGKQIIDVNDDDAQLKLDTCISRLTNINTNIGKALNQVSSHPDNKYSRNGYTSLQGASFASVSNASTMVVAAASNVNGVLIKHACLATHSTGHVSLVVNGNVLAVASGFYTAGAMTTKTEIIRDMFIPAGWSVQIVSTTADSLGTIFYEVL